MYFYRQFRQHKRFRPWTALVFAASLVACGGADESTGNNSADTGEQVARETLKNALEITGLTVETEDGSLAMGFEHDGESASMGENLPVPAWLPKGFPLPADLSIVIITQDQSGQKRLQGASTTVSHEALAENIAAWATRKGWEVIRQDDLWVTIVNESAEVIDVQAQDGRAVELEMSRRSVSEDRQRLAPTIVSAGSATVVLAGISRELAGECTIKGSSFTFEHSAVDGASFAQFSVQAADTQAQGSASYQTISSGGFTQHNINFPTGNDAEPVVEAAGKQFSVNGNFVSMGSAEMQFVPGSFAVVCE